MTRYNRRFGLAVLAAVTALAAMPSTYAADSYSSGERTKHRRPAGDKITTVCVPGAPDFDPEQCHKDITTGAPN